MTKVILTSVLVTLIVNKIIQLIENYNKCNHCKNFEDNTVITNNKPITPKPKVNIK